MELKYIVLTIIKIVISVPAVILIAPQTHGAALMGGHLDNTINSTMPSLLTNSSYKPPNSDSTPTKENETVKTNSTDPNELPAPSPLVLPGYNLPENIFNKGKPFYLEKDPLTGEVDFNSKTPSLNLDESDYEYYDEQPDMFDKSNIDRKDGSLYSHKPSDVNALTPNFHDFLNLPVKYNPDKYVHPLISSSYANTKIQGTVNKYQNHNNYVITTYKPNTKSPPYFVPSRRTTYFTTATTPTTTKTTTTVSTITTATPTRYTSKVPSLLESAMNHPSFQVDGFRKRLPNEGVGSIYLTTPAPHPSTTKRVLSLFEQLFGEYEDEVMTERSTTIKAPLLFANLPSNRNDQQKIQVSTTIKLEVEPPTTTRPSNDIPTSNDASYEYDDDYVVDTSEPEAVAYDAKPAKFEVTPETSTRSSSATNSIASSTASKYEVNATRRDDNFVTSSTETTSTSKKVTSLPLGENHVGTQDFRPPPPPPLIAVTHNLREQLNNEKVIDSNPFGSVQVHVPSSNSIHIAPDQDTVSFVVGHQQSFGTDDQDVVLKGSYDTNPFRPIELETGIGSSETVSYHVHPSQEYVKYSTITNPQPFKPPQQLSIGGSTLNIQPIKSSETSLSIGVPVDMKKVPGQVVDDDLQNENIKFPKKGSGAKIVFPIEKDEQEVPTTVNPGFKLPSTNREVLKLNSKPMLHQLPSDLTPPSERENLSPHPPPSPPKNNRPRPPWDPRPGHFHNGRPEYIRPPRPPHKNEAFKRIDNLPNILPQFRPNVKLNNQHNPPPHYFDHHGGGKNAFLRQPLLDRPSNRPIGFIEKMGPPPMPPKSLQNIRKLPALEQEIKMRKSSSPDDVIQQEQFAFLQNPPKVPIANRRNSEEPEIETLQMIQAKQIEKKEALHNTIPATSFKTNLKGKDSTEKPLYVVYPVNSAPIKLDALDSNKKETVVVGTRAELPLPPSKINHEFNYESPKDRNDFPILKPHPKPSSFPISSDFPYPLERPNFGDSNTNILDSKDNQWTSLEDINESRVANGNKINYKNPNQISATLKTYTEKPIAVAYTPTESHKRLDNTEKYSMPNYAGPVISEIYPGIRGDSEVTVGAVMRTDQMDKSPNLAIHYATSVETESTPEKLDFQAPFQASVNVDGISHSWTVVRNENKSNIVRSDRNGDKDEVTTIPIATTSEFDMENFKPQLFGGFKPIYSYPEENSGSKESEESSVISDRQE